MSNSDQQRWDARYARFSSIQGVAPAPWLVSEIERLPRGAALDLACGRGGNAIYLASQGFAVDAIDVSPVGLQLARRAAEMAGQTVNFICQDLLAAPDFADSQYQLIVMFHFIAPSLLARLPQVLAPGGLLMVEEHLRWPGAVAGPGSDRFRVAPGELAQSVPELDILVMQEALVMREAGPHDDVDQLPFALSRLLARRPT